MTPEWIMKNTFQIEKLRILSASKPNVAPWIFRAKLILGKKKDIQMNVTPGDQMAEVSLPSNHIMIGCLINRSMSFLNLSTNPCFTILIQMSPSDIVLPKRREDLWVSMVSLNSV